MEIRKQQNLFQLLLESFALLNRSGGAIVACVIVFVLFTGIGIALNHFGVDMIFIKLINFVLTTYLSVVLFRILGAKAEKTDETVSNSLSAAVFPTLYQLAFNILYGILMLAFVFVITQILKITDSLQIWMMQFVTRTADLSTYIGGLLILAVPFYVAARLMYAPVSIALREQGPINAIRYSFQLTSGKRIFTALGALLIISFLPLLFLGAVVYGGYVAIPLYFADSFNLAQLSPVWIGVLAGVGLIYLLLLLAMPAFLVLVFLNQDYGHNRDSFTPQAELDASKQEPQFGPRNGAQTEPEPEPADVLGVEVLSSSVSANAEETQQHLQQVYQPKPEDLVQYSQEEDRMPTILFDDDMARQIEEERAQWEIKQKQDQTQKKDDDAPTIKMSK